MGQGGAERIFRDLCNELAREHDLTVISYNNPFILDTLDARIRQVVIPKTSRHNPFTYVNLYRMLKQGHFDIVHTHAAKASEVTYTVSRYFPICQVATKHNPRKGPIFEKVRHVASVSAIVAETISRESTIIYNGIVPGSVQPDGLKHRPFTVLGIGRLEPVKGFDRLVEQVAKLEIDCRLDIIGEGPHRETLQQLITKTGQTERIRLLGFRTDIAERMSRSDLVVVSSHSEGFSLILVEALFYANLLISTNVGIAPEVLDGTLLIDPERMGEKIGEIAANLSTYKCHFESIRKQSRVRFTIKSCADQYVSFYRKILGQPSC